MDKGRLLTNIEQVQSLDLKREGAENTEAALRNNVLLNDHPTKILLTSIKSSIGETHEGLAAKKMSLDIRAGRSFEMKSRREPRTKKTILDNQFQMPDSITLGDHVTLGDQPVHLLPTCKEPSIGETLESLATKKTFLDNRAQIPARKIKSLLTILFATVVIIALLRMIIQLSIVQPNHGRRGGLGRILPNEISKSVGFHFGCARVAPLHC
jgi:hypothetical protein